MDRRVVRLSTANRRRQDRIAAITVMRMKRLWRRVDPDAIDASYGAVLPQLVATVSAGQFAAASQAGQYVTESAIALGVSEAIEYEVVPARFAGQTAAQVPFEDVLRTAVIRSKMAILSGATPRQALAQSGFGVIGAITAGEVGAAAAGAADAGFTANRKLTGYVRVVTGDSTCARCIILAGKIYKFNTGFRRHPRCNCTHMPLTGELPDSSPLFDPMEYFNSLNPYQADRVFGPSGAEAIRDGANIYKVVNANRGMSRPGDRVGREAKYARSGGLDRLSPAGIYAAANGSRKEATRLFRYYGYLSPYTPGLT